MEGVGSGQNESHNMGRNGEKNLTEFGNGEIPGEIGFLKNIVEKLFLSINLVCQRDGENYLWRGLGLDKSN